MKTDSLTATYRVVTPLFLGGAEPTAEAELRVPSIKGALRFWWRALMWSKMQDVEGLRGKEAVLFGSSDRNIGQSKVLMRLSQAHSESNFIMEKWSPNSWQRYTGYGLCEKGKGERKFIKEGYEWNIHFNLRRCDEEQSEEIVKAVKLLGLVGGLGSRSRKGWGSITLVKLEGADWKCPDTPDAWQKTVRSLLPEKLKPSAPFTAFTQSTQWNAAMQKTNAEAAQQWIGSHYQDMVKNTQPKQDRAQFGLPRKFGKGTRPRMERRASPLFLHIHQCSSGKALPCAIWLPADFLKDEKNMPGNGDAARQFVQQPNASNSR